MKLDIAAVFGQIVGIYTRLPLAQKIALPFLAAASMAAIIFVAQWANEPDYQVLFSNLEDGDAASVVERLRDMKVGYRLRDNGGTVEVTPPRMVNELRLDLAAAGLPKGGSIGFELFNENALGRTGFVERLTYVRALQGELERTIASIQAVRMVRVHITQPERSVFVSRDVLPTASVLLKLKAGHELTKKQVKGIANLVSSSVERLTADNVTILDSQGTPLSENPDEQDIDGADFTRLDYQRKIEQRFSKRIESMLTEILGPGKVVAKVTADLDFSKFEKEEEAFDPGGQVARSERSIEENAGMTAEGGVPGVLSNLTSDQGVLTAPDSAENSNTRRETVRNFEISRAVSRTAAAQGKILRITAAVLVDGQREVIPTKDIDPETGALVAMRHYAPLNAEMMRKIDNLVKQAIGYDSARGDVVRVENIQFFEPDESLEQALIKAETQDMIFKAAAWVLPALFTLLFFFIVLRPLVRFLTTPTDAEVDLSRLLPAGLEELEAELSAERGKVSSVPDKVAPKIDIEEVEELLSENSRLVKENPQQAALLIRYWLNEGRGF